MNEPKKHWKKQLPMNLSVYQMDFNKEEKAQKCTSLQQKKSQEADK